MAVGPTGRLRLVPDEEANAAPVPEAFLATVREGFSESNAAGLVRLAGANGPVELPATFTYWRTWVRQFFRAVCHAEDEPGESWRGLPSPSDEELAELVSAAPPMVGLEFVTVPLFAHLWQELCEYVADESLSDRDGPTAWLQRINPLAHLVGKVTFHLAENKCDPERPFAFLATFAHKLSANAKPQHRPLAEALKQSVAAADREQLERLLEPVRRAAGQSPLVAELVKSKRLFAPQAWTASEAYRFLQESSMMEESGVVIRLPNWWSARRPVRPKVEVRIGEKRPSAVGVDSLLDFQAHVMIDGEPLSKEELKRLMSDSPGLMLLKGKWVEVDQERLKQALDHWQQISEEHPDGLGMIEGMRMLAGVSIGTSDDEEQPAASWSTLIAGGWLRETLERIRTPGEEDSGCQPGRDLQATLRPYQADGVRWLWFMTEMGWARVWPMTWDWARQSKCSISCCNGSVPQAASSHRRACSSSQRRC